MLDLTGATAAVSTDLVHHAATRRSARRARSTATCATSRCRPTARSSSSPPPGGPHSGTLCDTAARFETYAVGTALTPTWTNNSGGDTLWGVEITQAAVYVGGHKRWMNNPNGSDRAAQGAVPAAGPGRARPADRRPAEVEPRPQPARRGGLRDLRDRRRRLGRQRHRLDRRPPLPASAHRVLPLRRGLQHRVEEHRLAARQRLRRARPLAASNVLYRVNAGGAAIASTRQRPGLGCPTTAPPARSTTPAASTATLSALDRGQPGQRPGVDAARHLDPGAQRPHRRQRDAVDLPGRRRHQHPGAALLRQPVARSHRGASTCSSTASPSCRTTTPTSTRASTRAP